MYNLGEQFTFDYNKSKAASKAVIQGKKYRITVLTERLVRLEYNAEGIFEDRPTEQILYRNVAVPLYQFKENEMYLEIKTKYFRLLYTKEKPFTGNRFNQMANFRIELLNTENIWYFGHPEARNYGAPYLNLMDNKGKIKYQKSLYSLDGFTSIDDSKSKIIEQTGTLIDRSIEEIDTYVFLYGTDFEACLRDYFLVTGAPALLPRYAFGNWWSRNVPYNDESLHELVAEFEKQEIPLSIILLNPDWHLRSYGKQNALHTGFTFDSSKFSSPTDMVSYLHTKGIRLGLSVNPTEGFYPYDTYYDKAKGYLEADKNGIIPFNALDPKTMDVYLKLFIHPLDNFGIDFYFIDIENDKDIKNLWALNHYHFYDMMRDYKRRPMLLSRNAGIGAHRYPALYSGKTVVSWETLKQIPFHNGAATNLGVSFWSHDIGGYYKGTEDNELYTRYVQLGTFSPILKFGSEKGKYYKREPWKWSVKTYEIVKDYLNLRHRMIPYLYTEAYNYHAKGIPLMVPIYYKFPELYDDELYKNEYYLGSQIFVSPIVSKKDYVMNRVIHRIFMPEGTWYDFVTGKKFPGNKRYVSFFKDNEYPVFVKEGSILVLGDNENVNDTTPPNALEIQIFPGKSNSYTLYEDDGLSDLYKKGYYLKTNIDYNYLPSNYTVIVRALEGKSGIVPPTRNYTFRFRNTKKSNDVTVYFGGEVISSKTYVDGTDFIVKVENVNTIGQLTINCKGKDIEIDAVRIINDEIGSIISDLQIETELKEKIDTIIFSDLALNKKRIEIRKLKNKGLEPKFVKLFLKLLEYVSTV
ncbi:MAG: glycoside hydrolase family 31 protein [Bacilli bacterium]|nr:glycoside hydrolase family 31 protein [Bacilli bacterium]